MNRYAIYCTKEQTKKAIELGAQPEIIDSQERVEKDHERIRDNYGIHSYEYRNATYYLVEVRYKNSPNIVVVNQVAYKLPTAEEMIGWLEDKGVYIDITNCYDVIQNYTISSVVFNPKGYTEKNYHIPLAKKPH